MIEIKHTLSVYLQYKIQLNLKTRPCKDFGLMELGIASSPLFERNLYMYRSLSPLFITGIEDALEGKPIFLSIRGSHSKGRTTFKKYHALGSAINLLTGEI